MKFDFQHQTLAYEVELLIVTGDPFSLAVFWDVPGTIRPDSEQNAGRCHRSDVPEPRQRVGDD